MAGFLIALISGAIMSIQGVFNTGVTKQTSVWVASSFVQLIALVVCIAAWFVTGKQGQFSSLFQIQNKYMLLGGALGALITYTVIQSIGMLGPAKATMLIVVSQLIVSYVIELLGLFGEKRVPFDWVKTLGLALMIVGILIFKLKK